MSLNRIPAEEGFSLLEALVAIVIVSLGLLGFAQMQALALNNTMVSRYHSLAASEVSSIAAAMSANHAYWGSSAVSRHVCVGFASGAAYIREPAGNYICPPAAGGDGGALDSQNLDCTSAACTPLQMAAFDLKRWGAAFAARGTLVSGHASISCQQSQPVSCLISLSWSEKNLALATPAAPANPPTGTLASASDVTQAYSEIVQP